MSQLMTRCADLLSSLYAPVPEDADDEDAGDTTTYSSNSTREMERGNRHVRENTLLVFYLAYLNIFIQLHTFCCNSWGDTEYTWYAGHYWIYVPAPHEGYR
jgi:hypothetical protein